MSSLITKIARAFGARMLESYLKMLARIFDAMMFANYCSGLLWSTNLNLGSGRTSEGIISHPVHGCIRTAPSRRMMQRNWHGCPLKKKCYREGAMFFFSSAVFWNRCTRLSNSDVIYSPIFQVKSPIFLLYFRSNILYFSYISGLNLLYSPIF